MSGDDRFGTVVQTGSNVQSSVNAATFSAVDTPIGD